MRRLVPFVILAGSALLAACVSHVPAPAAANARAAIPSAAPAARGKQASSTLKDYQRVVVNGQAYFCRYEVVTGSLIKQQVCLTRAQLTAQRQAAQRFVQRAQQYSSTCTTALTPGGGDNCQP
jgi:hypothetical protein